MANGIELPRANQGAFSETSQRRSGTRSLTSADVPTVTPAQDPGVRVPEGAFSSTLGIAAQELTPGIDTLIRAQQRIAEREGIVDEFKKRREFQAQAEKLADSAFADAAGPVDDERLAELGAAISQLQNDALASHKGTRNTRAALETSLIGISDKIIGSMSTENAKRIRAGIDEQLGIDIRSWADQVVRDPNKFHEAVRATEALVDRTAGVIGAEAAAQKKRAAVSMFTELTIQRIMRGPGGPAEAQDVMGIPEVQRLLTDEAFSRLQFNIVNFKDEALQTVTVFDPTSPTLTRIVSEREALGQAGPPQRQLFAEPKPFLDKLEGLEAQGAFETQNEANTAQRDLTELRRIDAALQATDKGGFTTGTLGEVRATLARAAEFFGAPKDVIDKLGDPAVADTLDAASKTLAVNIAENLGRVTNLSLGFIRDSLPSLFRTPEGNRILVEVMQRTAQRKIDIAVLQEEFISKNGTLRPQGKPSFFTERARFEADNPIVDDALRERIIEGTRKGKESPTFADLRKRLKTGVEIPEDVVIPDRLEVIKIEGDKITVRDKLVPRAESHTGPLDAFRVPKQEEEAEPNKGKKK